MQNDTIVGRCNREFDFHLYDLVNTKDEYEECDDDSLQALELDDIVMPEQFEMLRDVKEHAFNFDKMGELKLRSVLFNPIVQHLRISRTIYKGERETNCSTFYVIQ